MPCSGQVIGSAMGDPDEVADECARPVGRLERLTPSRKSKHGFAQDIGLRATARMNHPAQQRFGLGSEPGAGWHPGPSKGRARV